jgi:hypothetical protein
MAKPKMFRLSVDFASKKDMEEWAASTEKRPYVIGQLDAFDNISGAYTIKRHKVVKFLDEDAPLETDLHPIAQGIRFSRLG